MPTVPAEMAVLAFAISSAFVAIIVVSAHLMIKRFRKKQSDYKTWYPVKLRDIMRDENWYPSLPLFQFVIWTSIIGFLYFGTCLTRIFGGVLEFPPTIPSNLLILMGISVAVPVVSGGISAFKYTSTTLSQKETIDRNPLLTMLEENKKPSLSRFQMFVWTWIGVVIYLFIFTAMITKPGALQAVENLHMPDIDPTLVMLMGLSQGAYLGGKLVTTQSMEITKIDPPTAKVGETISVIGTKFGDKPGTVLFKDEKNVELSVEMLPSRGGILPWSDARIDVKIPAGLQKGDVSVSISAGGLTTLPKQEAKFVLT